MTADSPLRRVGRTVRSFLFWSHERGSWQYDVMVGLIVAFVLLTPTRYFHDKPVYNPVLLQNAVRLESDRDGTRYRVSAEMLAAYDDNPRRAAEEFFPYDLGHPVRITRIEPIRSEEGAVVWYDVWVRE
jgi:hypothetical protein